MQFSAVAGADGQVEPLPHGLLPGHDPCPQIVEERADPIAERGSGNGREHHLDPEVVGQDRQDVEHPNQ
ncbi:MULTISPECIES: hypothetical protein [Thermomonosporaceae]|uniref:hypothetical protein n=1 Tax=Thermomonosporaceae TaxID=2012 RepID=UPI00255AF4F9|nr:MULTISPECIES: hypothetical protein [Thermomonosporaceae]MDL4774546.1 hypothetical protein [Actinomadura xylanilytica]